MAMIYPVVGIPVCGRQPNPSPYHTHPRTKYPVPRRAVESQLYDLYKRGGLPGEPNVAWPNDLAALHEREPRRYAQVYSPPGPPQFAGRGRPRFEFAEQARWLPAPHRLGLVAHEVGHVLAGDDGSEEGADRAAAERLGVKIGYDRRWPGKGLQVARNPRMETKDWLAELARRLSPEELKWFPRLGDTSSEGESYTPRLKGDVQDQVLQALAQAGEGDVSTVEALAEATKFSPTAVRKALTELVKGRYPLVKTETQNVLVRAGRSGVRSTSNRRVYSLSRTGAVAASWERQAAAAALASGVTEKPPEDMETQALRAGMESEVLKAERKKLSLMEGNDPKLSPRKIEQPPFVRFQLVESDPFDPNGEVVIYGELVMLTGTGDDRSFGGIDSGYAVVVGVYVVPGLRRKFAATWLHELAAEEAHKRGLRLASSTDLPGDVRGFWIKQVRRGRAAPYHHHGPRSVVTRYMVHEGEPPGFHNPARRRGTR